jgi:hypothetical protein
MTMFSTYTPGCTSTVSPSLAESIPVWMVLKFCGTLRMRPQAGEMRMMMMMIEAGR